MGVDARILVKIIDPAQWVDAVQLRALSARLSDVIGHDHFFIKPEEGRHALSFVRDKYLEYFEDYNQGLKDDGEEPRYTADGPTVFWQDGDEIVAQGNEQFIEVNIWSRYYGEGYARGDWKLLHFVILWCMYNIPASEVWYGGDSSGCVAELMTPQRLAELNHYYLTQGHDEYFRFAKNQYKCEFCQTGVENSGGGGNHRFYHCNSCGTHWLLKSPDGAFGQQYVCVWGDMSEDNRYKAEMCSFQMSEEVRTGKRKVYPFDGTFRISYKTATPALT